ncbi:uncharacterized protein TM35_000721160 [Trypanosoma theileri]|uniref:Uncharacterized protein n=1 Tax=Trypanosoma theileri TaxID=67003 RepID=A0A1X0NG17_9TRYP|nr:uncharacterized protein TM35_000721160 [Trypanosoma theileri]ORC83413.1 hypothetical protein TM35_000721160 [Trypanosoma theileri]
MVHLTLEPTKWADAIESSPESLFSHESAKNVETVLSKASTRRHQKALLKAVEPFMEKMIEDPVGISILISLVSYGTIATVDAVTGVVLHSCDKILKSQSSPGKTCDGPLGTLLERIVYREDCTEENRMNLVTALKTLDHSLLMGNSVLLLAVARLIIIDRDFALSICSDPNAKKSFLQLASSGSKKKVVLSFCEFLLAGLESKDLQLIDLCSSFVFTALSDLFAVNSNMRPSKEITLLLASHGNNFVLQEMTKAMLSWSDICDRAKTEDYAKILAFLLARLHDANDGIRLIKKLFKTQNDVDEKLASRKVSHLQLLAAVAEKPVYVEALTKALGNSQEKKLIGAVARYRNATKPRALATKEVLLQRLEKIRTDSGINNKTSNTLKRGRE